MTTDTGEELRETFQFLTYAWDVDAAAEAAAGLPVVKLELAGCAQVLPFVRVDEEHAAGVDLERPVLAVAIAEMDGMMMVIDGWHRVARALKEGRTELPCRLLGEEEEFMVRLCGGRKGRGRRRRG